MSTSLEPTHTSTPPNQTTEATTDIATSVVLPTYNEAENIPQLVEELYQVFATDQMDGYRPFEIIFVDGGSDDGTRQAIRDLVELNPQIRSVFLKRKYGQSPALAAGFEAATGAYVIPMDADLQNDPADIPALIQKLDADGVDCVSGWRRDRNDPWHKTIPSAIQTRLAKATGPDINDFGCTLKVYRSEALGEIGLYGEGHRYIPAKLHKLGYSVDELEVNHRPREHGESRYGAGRLVRGFVDLLYHVFWVRWSTRPIHIFGGIGMAMLGIGMLLGSTLVAQNYLFGVDLMPNLPQLILSVTLSMFGFGMFSLGVITEMLTKLIYRDDTEYRVDTVHN